MWLWWCSVPSGSAPNFCGCCWLSPSHLALVRIILILETLESSINFLISCCQLWPSVSVPAERPWNWELISWSLFSKWEFLTKRLLGSFICSVHIWNSFWVEYRFLSATVSIGRRGHWVWVGHVPFLYFYAAYRSCGCEVAYYDSKRIGTIRLNGMWLWLVSTQYRKDTWTRYRVRMRCCQIPQSHQHTFQWVFHVRWQGIGVDEILCYFLKALNFVGLYWPLLTCICNITSQQDILSGPTDGDVFQIQRNLSSDPPLQHPWMDLKRQDSGKAIWF